MVCVEYVLVALELCDAELPKVAVQSCDLTLFYSDMVAGFNSAGALFGTLWK